MVYLGRTFTLPFWSVLALVLRSSGEVLTPLRFERDSWALALMKLYSLRGVLWGFIFPQVLLIRSGHSRGSVETPPVASPAASHHPQGSHMQRISVFPLRSTPWEITSVHHSAGSAVFPAVNRCQNESFLLGFPSLHLKTFCSDGNPIHSIFQDRRSEVPLRILPELTEQSVSRTRNKTHTSSPHQCHPALFLHTLAAAWRFTPSDFQRLGHCIPQNKWEMKNHLRWGKKKKKTKKHQKYCKKS